MMWGCMGWDGVRYSCRIEGKMNEDLYVAIMEDELQKSLKYWDKKVGQVIFQQDNDPKHTSKKAKTWFNDHGFEVMVWPPDINPIEHLWGILKRKLAAYPEAPWGMEEEECRKLIDSMPARARVVLKAKGRLMYISMTTYTEHMTYMLLQGQDAHLSNKV